MRSYIGFVLIVLLGVPVFSFSQNKNARQLNEALSKIVNRYKTDSVIKVDIFTNIYVNDKSRTKIDSSMGTYFFHKEYIRADMTDGDMSLVNDRWFISVSNNYGYMLVDTVINTRQKHPQINPMVFIDTTLVDSLINYKLIKKGDDNGIVMYMSDNGSTVEGTIIYDGRTGRLKYSSYKVEEDYVVNERSYAEGGYGKSYIIEMIFTDSWVDEAEADMFDESRFFRIAEGRIVPVAPYEKLRVQRLE